METSSVPPKDPNLTVEEENTLSSSPDLEIQHRDVWLMEDGDDSVFYSDEDQAHEDIKSNIYCDFSAKATEEPSSKRYGNPGATILIENTENNVTPCCIQAEQELQTAKTEIKHQTDSAQCLQPKCTSAVMQVQPQKRISSEQASAHIREEVVHEKKPDLELFDTSNEVTNKRLNEGENVPEQTYIAGIQVSDASELKVEQEPKHDCKFQVPVECHPNPSPGYSTLPVPKKFSPSHRQHNSFNHLASSKYSTVSYRKIRRGNTRQKIEEFEDMIIN